MLITASFWITPLHEAAHQLAGIIAGGTPEGIDLWFQWSLLVGETHNSLFGTGGMGELFVIAGPILFLYIPATVGLLVWRKKRGFLSLFPALLVGQGGLYTGFGLVKSYGDSWEMVQIGVPVFIISIAAAIGLITGAVGIRKYVKGEE